MTPTDAENDRMFGAGQWVRCEPCQGVHHRAYHDAPAAAPGEGT